MTQSFATAGRHGARWRRFVQVWVGAVLAVGLVLSACGGDDGGGGDATEPTGGAGGATTTAAGASTTLSADAEIVPHEQGQGLKRSEPRRGGSVVVGMEAVLLPLEPALPAGQTQMNNAIHGEMLSMTEDGTEYAPGMLESVTSDDSLTVWTAKLRPDLKYSDGTQMTAADIAANWTWLMDPANKWPYTSTLAQVASWRAVDNLTFEAITKAPFPGFPYLFTTGATSLTPKPAQRTQFGTDYGRNPMGAGPFMLKSWSENRIEMERNPNYYKPGLPYLDGIVFVSSIDSEAEIAALETGDIDIALSQIDTDYARAESKGIKVLRQRTFTYTTTVFNVEKEPVDDVRVRRALKMAIDEEAIVEAVFDGQREVAIGPVPENHPYFVPVEGWPTYDPDEAKRLIQEYETETGKQVKFEFDMWDPPEMQRQWTVINQMWAAVGAEVTMRPLGQPELIADTASGDFVSQSRYWSTFRLIPDSQALNFWSSGGGQNIGRMKNPVIDAALQIATQTDDRDVRLEQFGIVQQEIAKDLSILYHNLQAQSFMVGEKVMGFPGADPAGAGTHFVTDEIWV